MRFCFMSLIIEDLSLIKSDWNVHIISRNRNGSPRGRHDTMFNLPHCYSSQNYLTRVENEETWALYAALESPQEDYSEFFHDFATLSLHGQDRLNPSSVSETLQLYLYLSEKNQRNLKHESFFLLISFHDITQMCIQASVFY